MRLLLRGDARALPLVDASIDCVITSPPYWGLRDYGHDAQIGHQETVEAYVETLVAVFREVSRVLKRDGTVWLNLGDSYVDKNLAGVPWRVALALQADGWLLRSDIIWSKRNIMPESISDRPTKSHEYVFLLAKQERYWYDADAIREPHLPESLARYEYGLNASSPADGFVSAGARNTRAMAHSVKLADNFNHLGRNKRSVWTLANASYRGAHFATMPEALVEPCILAGCPLGGCVLDPFVGSGTTIAVAERLGRHGVGVDLSYQELAKERTSQRGLVFA